MVKLDLASSVPAPGADPLFLCKTTRVPRVSALRIEINQPRMKHGWHRSHRCPLSVFHPCLSVAPITCPTPPSPSAPSAPPTATAPAVPAKSPAPSPAQPPSDAPPAPAPDDPTAAPGSAYSASAPLSSRSRYSASSPPTARRSAPSVRHAPGAPGFGAAAASPFHTTRSALGERCVV